MTLLELLIVVAIVSVLAAVAVMAYRRYLQKAHASEVPLMFAEFHGKQEAYAAEFGSYVDVPTMYPAMISEEPTTWDPTAWPADWTNLLHINPAKAAFYCQYETRAGTSSTPPTAPAEFTGIYDVNPPSTNWFYIHAVCDLDTDAAQSEYFQRGDVQQLFKANEGS